MTLNPSMREAMLHVAEKMPMAPVILAQLGRLLLYADTDLADIIGLLRRDPALTSRLIRLANSVVYGGGDRLGSLDEALARVGCNEVYRLTGLAAVAELSERAIPLYGITAAEFRGNSVLTALIIERLVGQHAINVGRAYTAGLLRNVGKITLDRAAPASMYRVPYRVGEDGELAAWERAHMGMTNCEVGALVLEHWRFPYMTVAAVAEHYEAGPESSALANLLNLAAGAAARCNHGLPGEDSYWSATPTTLVAAGVSQAVLDEATRSAMEAFEPIRTVVG